MKTGCVQLRGRVVPPDFALSRVLLPRRTSLEVRACSKLSLLSEATRALSSSALDTYCLTCGKASYIDLT